MTPKKGDSREHPLRAERALLGASYGGWDCKACGKLVAHPEPPENPPRGDYAWMECGKCGAVHCYQFSDLRFTLHVDLDELR